MVNVIYLLLFVFLYMIAGVFFMTAIESYEDDGESYYYVIPLWPFIIVVGIIYLPIIGVMKLGSLIGEALRKWHR